MDRSLGTVLIVDDTPLSLEVTEAVMRHAGFASHRAMQGAEALALARSVPFDCILLDVQMPVMDGWEVCRALKADERTRAIPVIFMTAAHGEDEDVIRGLDLGGADYVTKPVHPRILVRRVGVAVRAFRAEADQRRIAEERADALRRLGAAQAQALEGRKLAGLATMARGLAHEINNPLAAALGNLHFLRADDVAAAERAEIVEETVANLRRVAAIVDRMRRLGGEIEQASAAPLHEIVEITSAAAAGALGERSVRLEVELAMTPPVPGGARLAPVVSELLTNAGRAVADGGRITVRVGAGATHAVLVVEDDGPGMDEATRTHAFEPFYTSKTDWRAIGLGLAMCHAVVSDLGGDIELASEPGRGTRVIVRVPLAAAD